MDSPLIKRGRNEGAGAHGNRAEKKAAKRLGGSATPGSGALDGAKGDINLDHFLVESKSTTAESMRLELAWLRKIAKEALEKNKYPALAVQFVIGNGEPVKVGNWVMVPERVFHEFLEKSKA
jgi:hypothetical protein